MRRSEEVDEASAEGFAELMYNSMPLSGMKALLQVAATWFFGGQARQTRCPGAYLAIGELVE